MRIFQLFVSLCIFTFNLFAINTIQAQQLVPNPGFEGGWSCPEDFTAEPVKELIPHWKNPNKGTPDYFHRCSDKAGIPNNFAGNADALEGDAYIGLILREVFNDSLNKKRAAREYIEVELSEKLEFRQLYCFNLKYRQASHSVYATDGLGVAFTREQLKAWNFGILSAEPMVFNLPGKVMENKGEWKELCGVFRARGREQYLTIGNFAPNEQSYFYESTDSLIDSAFVYAYYYIDDIKLFKIENHFECGCLDENSVGYDWLADDPKSYLDYYYENLENIHEQQLLALNNTGNNGETSNSNSDSNNNASSDSENSSDNNSGDNSSDTNTDENGSNDNSDDSQTNGNNSDQNTSNTNGTDNNLSNNGDETNNGNLNNTQTGNLSGQGNGSDKANSRLVKPGDENYPLELLDRNDADAMAKYLKQNNQDNANEIINSMRNASSGYSIDLPRIYFAFNQSELLPSSFSSLELLAEILNEKPDMQIEIRGHTDNIGSNRYNKKLSLDRAESVYQFLIEAGIDKSRLDYKGLGNESPVADNNTEFGRQLNRRVEIIVMEN